MNNEKLPVITKIMYGSGDFTNALILTTIRVYFLKFLVDVVQLDPGLVGIAIFVGRSADWINDPLVGFLSDRTQTRWGRRRPFLLIGMIPLALTFIFFFWVPPFTSQIALVAYYAVMYMLLDTAATLVYMPYYALTPEMTLDYDERTSLSTYRMMFNIGASLIAYTTPPMIIRSFADPRTGHFALAIIYGTVGVLPLLLTFFGTRERTKHIQQKQPTLRESFNAIRRNKPFLYALGIFLVTWMVLELIQPVLPFFIEYTLDLADKTEILLGSVFVSAAVFLPLWMWLSEKWDKTKAYIAGTAYFAVIMIILIFMQRGMPLSVLVTFTALAGVGVAAAHVMPWAILPDAMEWDELQTGQRHEGAFYSAVTLAQKIASSIMIPLVAVFLDISGYVPNAPVQTAAVQWTLRFMMAGLPALLLIVGIVFALRYPLTRERHEEIREQLAKDKASAQSTL